MKKIIVLTSLMAIGTTAIFCGGFIEWGRIQVAELKEIHEANRATWENWRIARNTSNYGNEDYGIWKITVHPKDKFLDGGHS